ncbi:pectin lyase fold/virulence factor [Rhexocercosporidium sp. MPI-PUGE-AT-0058]|nr:pectin lyase fold/virulence factor [Rhexocercosporidium sp. MPI-PUGE-AT-0058]
MPSYRLLLSSLLLLIWVATPSLASEIFNNSPRKICTVRPGGSNLTDDAPEILRAFSECGHGGTINFLKETYHVNTVMNTTGLRDCVVNIPGTLLWGTDILYWLNHSLPVGYQNQSTAWVFGGDRVKLNGFGTGVLDGNGATWYKWIRQQPNTSNYPGRPHAITFNGLTNSVVMGLSLLRSQMWSVSVIHSHHVLFDSIVTNSTVAGGTSSNTDGADTMFSHHITFTNWTVENGDDSISLKANSTDISISDSRFINGLGIAIGSIGQYRGQFETVERLRVNNCSFTNTLHAAYFKTWTGESVGYPPNGGGGGLGFAKYLNFTNLHATGMRAIPLTISQCTRFMGSGGVGNCTSSLFKISDVSVRNIKGTTKSNAVASFQCSALAPCERIRIEGVDLVLANGTEPERYLCDNVKEEIGWKCNGKPCIGGSAVGGC